MKPPLPARDPRVRRYMDEIEAAFGHASETIGRSSAILALLTVGFSQLHDEVGREEAIQVFKDFLRRAEARP